MRLLVLCVFLNEERHLPVLLDSMLGQTRRPDRLALVDDGSTDASARIAAEFAAANDFAVVLRRPPRPPESDRLAFAGELRAFHWALAKIDYPYEALCKLDGDLRLTPPTFAHLLARLEEEPRLGMVGPYLSAMEPDGRLVREFNPPYHVRGPLKLYRRECFDQISPLPEIPGWETVDEVAARMHGWETRSEAIPGGDPVHLRPTGTGDGALRGYRRSGRGAWAYGAHPLHVVLGAVRKLQYRPRVLGGVNYLLGWAHAGLRDMSRADPEIRAYAQREQLARIRGLISTDRLRALARSRGASQRGADRGR